jgi:signal transduction histidine kinase/CheY-like chemotaxis protein
MVLACAAFVGLIAVLTLAEYFSGRDLWIDRLLFDVKTAASEPYPARMAPVTAIDFLFLSLAFFLHRVRRREGVRPAEWLALLAGFSAFVALLGYIYGVDSLYRVQTYSSMALHTACVFLILATGFLGARPGFAIVASISADDASGFMIRRLLPAAILVPPTVGWIRLKGQQAGGYTTEFGLAIFATANVLIFSALVWRTALAVRRADRERNKAQSKLQAQLGRLDLLNRIARAIAERQDLNSIFKVVVRSLEDSLPVDFACVCLYEPVAQVLTVASTGTKNTALGPASAFIENENVTGEQHGLQRCIHGELVYESDLRNVSLPLPQRLARAGMLSMVAAPLRAESKVFGVLVATRRTAASFSSSDCEFLRQLSEQVALASHQAQLHGALRQAYDELRQTQSALMQQERLRALGEMASGVAHDINNAISPISLYVDALLEWKGDLSDRARDRIVTIRRAILDVAETVARMREFCRPRELQGVLERIDLNSLVKQVVELTHPSWSDQPQERGLLIDFQTDLAANLPEVMGAENEIRDALTNLVLNAIDALPQGGLLKVRTYVENLNAGPRNQHSSPPVYLEVTDSGIGMNEETRRRCLEPFFTTKGEGGTGLGLAMVYGMVQRHGGELEIDSERGRGTTIRLCFSAASSAAPSADSSPTIRAPIKRLRILVVDDDPLVIEALSGILLGDGHSVVTAQGGQSAITALTGAHSRGESFSVVITDLGMPSVDGRQVAAAVKAVSPTTPVILLTGWGRRMLAEHDIPPHVDRVMSKPPRLPELRCALADVTAQSE